MATSSRRDAHADRPAASLGALRRFVRPASEASRATQEPPEHCDLCNVALLPRHRHLLELSNRSIACACDACAMLFSEPGAGGGNYRIIPRRALALLDFQMTDAQWDELLIPVNMAYFFRGTGSAPVQVFYPSPAGAMESLLSQDSWATLLDGNPILHDLEPEVEALLINRIKGANEYYLVPIDACYQLVGVIRLNWRGLSGGEAVWEAIGAFFAGLRASADPVGGAPDAGPEL